MAGGTPNKKLQLRTSDLTEFFRGSSSGPGNTGSTASSSAVLDDSSGLSSSSPSKKIASRIPFIGRSRKKSTHSDVVAPVVAASDATERRTSVMTVESRRVNVVASIPHASTSQSSLKSTAASTGLGSRIAAHFTPSKDRASGLRRFQSRKSQRSVKPRDELSDYHSDSLALPNTGARSSSVDSSSSRVGRSSTPRASQASNELGGSGPQPTITVSRPPTDDNPEDLSEYDDLFTKPRQRIKPKPASNDTRLSEDPETGFSHLPSLSQFSSTSSTTGQVSSGTFDDVVSNHRMFTESTVHKSAADLDSGSVGSASITSVKRLPRRPMQSVDIDPAEESEAMSVKSAMSMPTSFGRARKAPSGGTNENFGVLGKHRSLATPSSTEKLHPRITQPSKPPSRPLPATPTFSHESPSSSSQSAITRQRAHTISTGRSSSLSSSVPGSSKRANTVSKGPGRFSPLSKDSLTSNDNGSSSSSSSTPTITKSLSTSMGKEIDIDNASADELREALRLRNKQFNDLTDHILKLTETHAVEKSAWEKKVVEMEKEIRGLGSLIKNGRRSILNDTGTHSGSRTPSLLEMERERSDDSSARSSLPTPSSSIRLPLHRLLQGEDSGTESFVTSTSDWGTSGAEDELHLAALKPRRTMRKLKLVESVNRTGYIARPIPLKQPGPGPLPTGTVPSKVVPNAYISKMNRRSSASSSNSFPVASSASSDENSPISITFPAGQTLIPIPETRNIYQASLKDDFKRERKSSRSSIKSSAQPSTLSKPTPQSRSIPSVTPGSRLTPSEELIRSLKKGRPPSIAQVLDQTKPSDQPTVSNIEDSYGGRSRALLAGMNQTVSD